MKNIPLLLSFLEEERGSTERINMDECNTLLEITAGCRPSMHEPDEQGVSAEFLDDGNFDNAGGSEMAIYLTNDSGRTSLHGARFNMASLVALARIGAQAYLIAHGENIK